MLLLVFRNYNIGTVKNSQVAIWRSNVLLLEKPCENITILSLLARLLAEKTGNGSAYRTLQVLNATAK
jgi:hypothetical protein